MSEAPSVAIKPSDELLDTLEVAGSPAGGLDWERIFHDAAAKPRLPFKDGALAHEIDAVLEETNRRLSLISTDLRPEHLQPDAYISGAVEKERNRILNTVGVWSSHNLKRVSTDHRLSLARVGIRHVLHTPKELIEPGVLESPPFYGNSHSSKCALFCFQMIANDILSAKDVVSDSTLFRAVSQTITDKRMPDDHKVDYDVYAHALTSEQVAEASGTQTEYVQIRGATLRLIGKITSGIRLRNPEARVFCTIPLQSDSFEDFWHQVVLTAATDKGVWVHNPGGNHARPDEIIDPITFYKKWSVCMNIAHLFISAPR